MGGCISGDLSQKAKELSGSFSAETGNICTVLYASDETQRSTESVNNDRRNNARNAAERQKQKKPKEAKTSPFDPKVARKYEMFKEIAKGKFSKVFSAMSVSDVQMYALKVMHGDGGKRMFLNELSILSRVQHPYIIPLIETFEVGDRFYMVFQLASGGDLRDRVLSRPERRLVEAEVVRIVSMILDAVLYLHDLGIIHRNLTLENLLFYHPGVESKVMLTDFGFARLIGDVLEPRCIIAEYAAPELIADNIYTYATDVWSVGIITYFLLSGHFPFPDNSPLNNRRSLYNRIVNGEYEFVPVTIWESVNELAKDFIRKLLEVDYLQRISANDAMQHPWIIEHLPKTEEYGEIAHPVKQRNNGVPCDYYEEEAEMTSSGGSSSSSASQKPSNSRCKSRDVELLQLKNRIIEHNRSDLYAGCGTGRCVPV